MFQALLVPGACSYPFSIRSGERVCLMTSEDLQPPQSLRPAVQEYTGDDSAHRKSVDTRLASKKCGELSAPLQAPHTFVTDV